MTLQGSQADQVTQVRGSADQRLRKPDAPLDPSNRRISLIVQYIQKPIEEPVAASGQGGKAGEGKAGGEAGAKPTGSKALPGGTEKKK
jgi:chemotaxis protein MotB